jgi:phage terminase large subunit-like protein
VATPDAPVAPIPSSTTEPWGVTRVLADNRDTLPKDDGRASAAVASASRAKGKRLVEEVNPIAGHAAGAVDALDPDVAPRRVRARHGRQRRRAVINQARESSLTP